MLVKDKRGTKDFEMDVDNNKTNLLNR